MKNLLVLSLALLTLSSSAFAGYPTTEDETLEGLSSLGYISYTGLTVTSVAALAKENIIQKATPAAIDYIENGTLTEDFKAGVQLILAEKAQSIGEVKVQQMIADKEITFNTLAIEIIERQ